MRTDGVKSVIEKTYQNSYQNVGTNLLEQSLRATPTGTYFKDANGLKDVAG
jgi:hypothetical protein